MMELLRFELRYHLRQPSFIAAAVFFFAMGFVIIATGFGPRNLPLNSYYVLMETTGVLSLLSVFAAAIFASQAVLRDSEYRMDEIIFATPVKKSSYIMSRLGGTFVLTAATFAFSIAGMLIATYMPWQPAERVDAFNIVRYLWPFITLALPNILTATAILSAVTVITRNALATYTASVLIYILYFVAAAFTNSPLMAASAPGTGGGLIAALIDPFGLSAFYEVTRYWTIAQKSGNLVPLSTSLLLNRFIWLAIVAILLTLIQTIFAFRLKRKSSREAKHSAEIDLPRVSYAPIIPTQNQMHAWIASYRSTLKLEFRSTRRGIPLLLVLWMILAATELYSDLFHGEYNSAFYPATALIIETLRQPIAIVSAILFIYYGAEILWRERQHGISSIINSTPVSASSIVIAKWTSLIILVFSVIASGVLVGVVLQTAKGYWKFEPAVYVSLFYFTGFPFVLFGAAITLIHTITPTKYVGMITALGLILFSLRGQSFGFEHDLWRFAAGPAVEYSSMNGFINESGFHWYMLYWSALAGMFVMAASQLWRSGWSKTGPAGFLNRRFAVLLVIFAGCGAWIYYNTNGPNAHTSTKLNDWKADYEKKYKPTASLIPPDIVSVNLQVDLYPQQRKYNVSGRYKLTTKAAMQDILVAVRRDARVRHLSLNHATLVMKDERFGMYRYRPNKASTPDELRFELNYEFNGFQEEDQSLVENGTAILNLLSVPTLGYRKTYELTDPYERKKRGLPETATAELQEASYATDHPEWISFAAQISTSEDQIAVAPGRLVRSWNTNGRRHFVYESDQPILNQYAIASGRYEVLTQSHNGVRVEVYYHAAHSVNAKTILRTAVDSLQTFEECFGRYGYAQLRVVEVPAYWRMGGFATANTVLLNENRSFLIDASNRSRPDLLRRRVAHEVAHLWWGYQLHPLNMEGASAIVESLAKYSELEIIRRSRGKEQVRSLLEMELDRYLKGRSDDEQLEPPLYKVTDQPHIFYSKGALVMNAIQDLIGQEAMTRSLAGFVKDHAGPSGAATSLDLLSHLTRLPNAQQRDLIREWMAEIVMYDLKLESAAVKQLSAGKYEVQIIVQAGKARADGAGNLVPVPFETELLDIAAFKMEPDVEESEGNNLYFQKHTIRQGKNRISIVVNQPPGVVAVDPYLHRIDTNRFDNWKSLQPFTAF